MKNILIKACTNGNLGDDLFVKAILERYKNKKIEFYVLVYNIKKYKHLLGYYSNVHLIKYPKPSLPERGFAKVWAAATSKEKELKKKQYSRAYKKLCNRQFHIFINIGGSQFAEYENEVFDLSFFLEKYIARNISAKRKVLLNINFGPYVTTDYRRSFASLLKEYDDVCFRDEYSFEKFSYLYNVRKAADVVLSMDLKQYIRPQSYSGCRGGRIIGINVINLKQNKRTYQERQDYIQRYENVIKETIKTLIYRGGGGGQKSEFLDLPGMTRRKDILTSL